MVISRPRTVQAKFAVLHGQPVDEYAQLDLGRVPDYPGQQRYDDHLYIICEAVEGTRRATPLGATVMAAIRAAYSRADRSEPVPALVTAIHAANTELYTRNHRGAPDARVFLGVTCLVVRDAELFICQVPPTQALISQNGTVLALPELASWRDDYQPHSYTGPGPYGLGMHAEVEPQLYRTCLEEGDLLALVSSNLARILADERIDPLIGGDPAAACEYFRELATERGLDLAYAAAIAVHGPDTAPGTGLEDGPPFVAEHGPTNGVRSGSGRDRVLPRGTRTARGRGSGRNLRAPDVNVDPSAGKHDPRVGDSGGQRIEVRSDEAAPDVFAGLRPVPVPATTRVPSGPAVPVYRSVRPLVSAGDNGDIKHGREVESLTPEWLDEHADDEDDDESDELDEFIVSEELQRVRPTAGAVEVHETPRGGVAAREVQFAAPTDPVAAGWALVETLGQPPATWQPGDRTAAERVARPLPLGSLERWDRGLSRRARGALAIAVFLGLALVAIVGSYVARTVQANAANARFTAQVQEIATAREQAVASPDKQAAHDRLLALRQSLAALPVTGHARWQEQVAREAAALAGAIDTVDGVTRIEPSQIRVLAQGPVPGAANAARPRLVLGNGQLFVLRDGTLFMADAGKQGYTRVLGRGDVVGGTPVGTLRGVVWRGDLLLAFDEAYTYARGTTTWTAAPLAAKGLRPDAVDTFDNNLYLLTRDTGEIAKFAAGQYNSPPQVWANAKNSATLTQGIDLAVDKDIYLLLADGRVADLYQGAEKSVFTPAVVPPLTSATALDAAQGGKYLFILDAASGRILRLTRDGAPLAIYKAPPGATTLASATEIAVDEPANMAYIVTDTGLLAMQLPPAP